MRAVVSRRCCRPRRAGADARGVLQGPADHHADRRRRGRRLRRLFPHLRPPCVKHIPGNPIIIPKNMPAASGLAAANTLYTTADKDGATIGAFPNNVPMDPLFGNPGARYDAQKLNWLGSIGKLQNVCATWITSPIKTIEQAREREVIVAGAGRHLQFGDHAEGAQRAARHQVQGHVGLRSRLRPHHGARERRGRGHLRPVVVDHEGVAAALDQGQQAQRASCRWASTSCPTCPTCPARSIS